MDATSPVGALLLCRTEPDTVRPVAHLLRERMLLAPAGEDWSVLVPEGTPWRGGDAGPPAERVPRGAVRARARTAPRGTRAPHPYRSGGRAGQRCP
nr:hypothetical protein [Streptomyces sp. or43]